MAAARHQESTELLRDSNRTQNDAREVVAYRFVSILVVSFASLRFAWLSDDALITVRTALNTIHGYGPVFNIDERVAGYTHPLWLALLIIVGWVTGDVILAPMILGVLFTALAWSVIVTHVVSRLMIVLGTVALVLSNSFVEYSASGLENPLAFAILSGLLVMTRRSAKATLRFGITLGLLTSALLLTRLDFALLVAPVIAWTLWGIRAQTRIVLGFASGLLVPLGVWALATIGYYGFLLPSTFAAKTNTSIPRTELLFTGFNYFFVSFANDPVSLLILITGAVVAFMCRDLFLRSWLFGVSLYLAYVVWVGGDFMAGRFMAVPVFVVVSALLLVEHRSTNHMKGIVSSRQVTGTVALVALFVLVVAGLGRSILLNPTQPEAPRWDYGRAGGVADERGYYLAKGRSLQQYLGVPRPPAQAFIDVRNPPEGWQPDVAQLVASSKAWPVGADTTSVETTCGGLGAASIVSGPQVHWIDPCGLTDRFLAGLRYEARDFAWRIGHFDRALPLGYAEAVKNDNALLVQDPELRWQLEYIWRFVRP